jgi:hypothetical protein
MRCNSACVTTTFDYGARGGITALKIDAIWPEVIACCIGSFAPSTTVRLSWSIVIANREERAGSNPMRYEATPLLTANVQLF